MPAVLTEPTATWSIKTAVSGAFGYLWWDRNRKTGAGIDSTVGETAEKKRSKPVVFFPRQ